VYALMVAGGVVTAVVSLAIANPEKAPVVEVAVPVAHGEGAAL
jgi:hypothetical protein